MIEYYNVKYCFSKLRPLFMNALGRFEAYELHSFFSLDDAFCFLNPLKKNSKNIVVRFPIKDLLSKKTIAIIEFGIYPSEKSQKWECKTIGCDDNDTKVKFLTEKRLEYLQFKDLNEIVNRIELVKINLDSLLSEIDENSIDGCLDRWSSSLVKWC